MASVLGFLGTAAGIVLGIVSAIVGVVVVIVLWKAGVLGILAEGFVLVLRGVFIELPVAAFNFLRDLVAFAAS